MRAAQQKEFNTRRMKEIRLKIWAYKPTRKFFFAESPELLRTLGFKSSEPRSKPGPELSVVSLEPLMVPLAEAAKLLGVKTHSMRQMCRQDILPYKKIGNRWVIPYQALKSFANNPKIKAVAFEKKKRS
jgi:helix-turn-helix protein